MSTYINFFIRVEDSFAPIGSYSRNSEIFKHFENVAPWEKIRPINSEMLSNIIKNIKETKEAYRVDLEKYSNEIETIKGFNNTVEEKLEALSYVYNAIEEINKETEELNMAEYYALFLINIYDEAKYDDRFNESKYLYVGMEISSPSINDVVDNLE